MQAVGDRAQGVPDDHDEEHDPEAGELHAGTEEAAHVRLVQRGRAQETRRYHGGAPVLPRRVHHQTRLPRKLRLLHRVRRSTS